MGSTNSMHHWCDSDPPLCNNLTPMRWLEQRIRRYEHARWTTDDNRRVYPFEWGLEHIGGRQDEADPRGFLNAWVEETLAHSDKWFATTPADDYVLQAAKNGASGGQ